MNTITYCKGLPTNVDELTPIGYSKFELFLGAFSDIFHAATVEAESLTRQSLQTFQEFNRRRLQADALKLLGEIYKHRLPHQPATAAKFFLESGQLYQELDLTEKAIEIERDS